MNVAFIATINSIKSKFLLFQGFMYYLNDGVYGSFLDHHITGRMMLPKPLEVSIFSVILVTLAGWWLKVAISFSCSKRNILKLAEISLVFRKMKGDTFT